MNETLKTSIRGPLSLKHGILSEALLLPHESEEEFLAVRGTLSERFRPQDGTEAFLVDALATVFWRKRRVIEAERALINQELARMLLHEKTLANTADPFRLHVDQKSEWDEGTALPVRTVLAMSESELEKRKQSLLAAEDSIDEAELILQSGYGKARLAIGKLPKSLQALWRSKERGLLDAESVRAFLSAEVMPKIEAEKLVLKNAAFLRSQAAGAAAAGADFRTLARYEAHLDRSLDKLLKTLIALKGKNWAAAPSSPAAELQRAPAIK